MYKRKTRDYWAVECKYCHGWEEVCGENTKSNAHDRYIEYVLNDDSAEDVRIVRRREKINE